jgi:hypothetical protein
MAQTQRKFCNIFLDMSLKSMMFPNIFPNIDLIDLIPKSSALFRDLRRKFCNIFPDISLSEIYDFL